jgi:hypothetical protein
MVAEPVLAAERVYNILTSQSSVAISGNLVTPVGTAQLQEQGPGSLTTRYSGTIRADRGEGSIEFLSGSVIDAGVSGNWRPLPDAGIGSAPADYGGTASRFGFSAELAARDLAADLNSGVLSVGGDGSFNIASTMLNLTNGRLACRSSIAVGVPSLVGLSSSGSGMGSVETTTGTETLTLPVNSTFSVPVAVGTTLNLTFVGQLVAESMLTPVLSGDYNQNGTVDAADYVLWRTNDGTQAGYDTWRVNFGASLGSGSGSVLPSAESLSAAVPEPSTWMLILWVAVGRCVLQRHDGGRIVLAPSKCSNAICRPRSTTPWTIH